MRDISYLISLLSAVFMLVAAGAWWRILRVPEARRNAASVGINSRHQASAAMVIVVAVGLGAVAAGVAIFARMFG